MGCVAIELLNIIAQYLHHQCGWWMVEDGEMVIVKDFALPMPERRFEYRCTRFPNYNYGRWFLTDMTGYPPFGALNYKPNCWKNEHWVKETPESIAEYYHQCELEAEERRQKQLDETKKMIIKHPGLRFWFPGVDENE